MDILKHPHRRVLHVVLHHQNVVLSRADVVAGVLENAARAIGAFVWVFNVILAH